MGIPEINNVKALPKRSTASIYSFISGLPFQDRI
jgi:hypothetical protein